MAEDLNAEWESNCINCKRGITEMRWSPCGKYFFYCAEVDCELSYRNFRLQLDRRHYVKYLQAKKQDGGE